MLVQISVPVLCEALRGAAHSGQWKPLRETMCLLLRWSREKGLEFSGISVWVRALRRNLRALQGKAQ